MTTVEFHSGSATGLGAAAAGGANVMAALKRAGEATGASFDLLYNMAKRESSLNPSAEAKTSSAAGLFQFIEQTWLGAVKAHGARHGLGEVAADITRNADGKLSVADPARRKEILDLRFDPATAAALAGELAQENRAGLERRLGRGIDKAELYAAHFLGVGGAAKLLTAAPDAKAAELLPAAAKANRNVFYDSDGAKTVAEVVASIERSMNAVVAPAQPPAPVRFAAAAPSPLREGPSVAEIALAAAAPEAAQTNAAPEAPQANGAPDTARADAATTERAGYAPPPLAVRAASEADELRLYLSLAKGSIDGGLTPLAVAVLQSLDPTRLTETDERTGPNARRS